MSGAQGLDVTMASALSPKKDAGLLETCEEVPAKECVMEKIQHTERGPVASASEKQAFLSPGLSLGPTESPPGPRQPPARHYRGFETHRCQNQNHIFPWRKAEP